MLSYPEATKVKYVKDESRILSDIKLDNMEVFVLKKLWEKENYKEYENKKYQKTSNP